VRDAAVDRELVVEGEAAHVLVAEERLQQQRPQHISRAWSCAEGVYLQLLQQHSKESTCMHACLGVEKASQCMHAQPAGRTECRLYLMLPLGWEMPVGS
jgi:hypothetical protein